MNIKTIPFKMISKQSPSNNIKTTPFDVILARGHGINAFTLV